MVQFKIPTKETYFNSDCVSTVEILKKHLGRINAMGWLIGCDILTESFSVNSIRFYVAFGNMIYFLLLNFYSLYLYQKDLVSFFFLLVTLAGGIQGAIRFHTFIFYRANIRDLASRSEKFLNNFKTLKTDEIFEYWLIMSSHVGLFFFVLFSLCSLLIFCYPIVYYLIVGETILHFGFELPLIDWKTTSGYVLNFLYCGIAISEFVVGSVTTCCLNICFVFNAFGQLDVLKMLLEELDEMIIKNEKDKNRLEIKKYIKMITDMHNELLE